MTDKRWIVVLVVLGLVVGLGYAGLGAYSRSQPERCYACQRSIHAHSRTVGIVQGKLKVFCCPACALSEHVQEGKPIRVTELTSFLNGGKLSPAEAFAVKGSDVNMCVRTHEITDADKRQADVSYDRCAPSIIAFGQRSEALQFAGEHGGEVQPFSELASAFTH